MITTKLPHIKKEDTIVLYGFQMCIENDTEEIEGNTTRFSAFSGYKMLIQETARKSFKRYIKALETLINDHKDLIKKMITAVCLQEGLIDKNIEAVYNEAMKQLKAHLKKETEML